MEKGRLIVQKSKKGFAGKVVIGNKEMPVPSFYELKDASLDGKECLVEREKGKIKRILVEGNELTRRAPAVSVTMPGKKQKEQDTAEIPLKRDGAEENKWSVKNAKLPKDTMEIIKSTKIDNFWLKFNKAANYIIEKEDEKFVFFRKARDKAKKESYLWIDPDFSNLDFEKFANDFDMARKVMEERGYRIKQIVLTPNWRVIVGLGNENVYETSLTLHHLYGFPIIPGQAIKGVLRNFILNEVFGFDKDGEVDLKKVEKRALKNKIFCDIFGCPKESIYRESRAGKVIFFDALPVGPPVVEYDVMNPHYGDYYQDNTGRQPPADYLNPKPVFFLTVKETPYRFLLGIKLRDNKKVSAYDDFIGVWTGIKERLGLGKGESEAENMSLDSDLLTLVAGWLKKTLAEHGIGAKSTVGYGVFNSS